MTNNVTVGATIELTWQTDVYWNYIIDDYNKIAGEADWPSVQRTGSYDMTFNCTVKDTMSSQYGKFPKDNKDRQIIMEFAPWFTMLSEHLPPDIENMPDGIPQEFMTWLVQNTTAFSFSSMMVMTLPNPRYLYYQDQSFNNI